MPPAYTLVAFFVALRIRIKQMIGRLKIRRRFEALPINRREYRVFSQHREDGIIDHLLESIGVDSGTFVEFGFSAEQCNCLNLAVNRKFTGVFVDGSPKKCAAAKRAYRWLRLKNVQVLHSFLTTENLNSVITGSGIPNDVDVLSIDVDGNDYWFWSGLEAISAKIVVIEYNASFGSQLCVTVPYDPEFIRYEKHSSGFYHGASLRALEYLGKQKGYRLVACDATGVNAFFLRDDLCSAAIETLSVKEAFRENRGRVKYKGVSQAKQLELIRDMDLVVVGE